MTPEQVLQHFMLREKDLAQIIDLLPYQPNTLQSLNLTAAKNISTTEVRTHKREGRISLIPTTERGGAIPQDVVDPSSIRSFPTYRIAKGATIYAHELQDVVAFGGGGRVLERVAAELTRRYAGLERDMLLTEENMLLGMVQGKIPDADGTVLIDYFDEWAITRPTPVAWDFANASLSDLRRKGNELYRAMGRALAGMTWSGRIGALMGDDDYDLLTTSAAVESQYLQHAAARELDTIGKPFEMFPFASIEWINYRGTDDLSTVKVPDGEIVFFPIGAQGMFTEVRAPGEDLDSVNKLGKRRFPITVRDPERNRYIKPELYTYPQFMVSCPAALRTGVSGPG